MDKFKMLGASLYVPATHKDLQQIADGELIGNLRSVIFCTEDAVADSELSCALLNLSRVLRQMIARPATARFVRVRNPEVMRLVLDMPGADKLTGFVLPKITRHNFDDYFRQVRKTNYLLMPTLETAEVFDESEMKLFRLCLERPGVRDHILALRIGGNDLLALLRIRRPRNMTLYRTPLGAVISKLVTIFHPYGFVLTAPVFEYLDSPALLAEEIAEDLAHGLVGKTAIHPCQVALIDKHYRVPNNDVEEAVKIIDKSSPAVFKMHESMCEVATHRAWAHGIIEQARVFGIYHDSDEYISSNNFQQHQTVKRILHND